MAQETDASLKKRTAEVGLRLLSSRHGPSAPQAAPLALNAKTLSLKNKTDLAAALNPVSSVRGSARALWRSKRRWAGRGRAEARHSARARPANSPHH